MKIKSHELRLIAVDATSYYQRMHIALQATWHWPLLILRGDDGRTGYATCFWPRNEGPGLARVFDDFYARDLMGLELNDHLKWWEMAMKRQRHVYSLSDGMVGMIDVALWDLRAKVANMPLYGLFGGVMRTRLPGYQVCQNAHMSPDEVYEDVKQVKRTGVRGYKLQMGQGPEQDIPKLRAAREAAGDDYTLMFDATGSYDFEQALIVGRQLDSLNYTWFEEPIPDRQYRQLRRLAAAIDTSVLTGETLRLNEIPEAIRVGAGDSYRGDVHIKAGVTGMRRLISMCEMAGVQHEVHTAVTPLMDLANLCLACTTRLGRYFEVHSPESRMGLIGDPLKPDADGFVHLPTAPGLGAELDWDWLDNHTVEQSSRSQ